MSRSISVATGPIRSSTCRYKRPDGLIDRRAVIVDQQAVTEAVAIFGKPGQMNLTDGVQRQRIEVRQRIALMVDARDVDVVDVEQQATAAAADDFS